MAVSPEPIEELDLLHRHERTGRTMGDDSFVAALEHTLGRVLQPQKTWNQEDKKSALGMVSLEYLWNTF